FILIDIAHEMERQQAFDKLGDLPNHAGQMAAAAACYATHAAVFARLAHSGVSHARIVSDSINASPPQSWPWTTTLWKPRSQRDSLIRAAALLIADLERLDTSS